ncbi:starch phosphorylase [Abditibacterium utsteinense]|uniref:Starch phosphorylase n=1 Tax=Abditibacterium utsteinense TaxID=1960156 RepID=A0A2S8SQ33_9BACT|nr:alpha-glucan family phosphorylase [Abditibacterium utsteinense]PQV62894.1 starch phosphorylase [Abditibacterium utsteinense]
MRISSREPRIAYFSMEIGFRSDIPTYSGGLGVLAGDTLKSAADLGLPVVAMSLLYNRGYFRQHLDADGWQSEEPINWNIREKGLELLPNRVKVRLENRDVWLQVWRFDLQGEKGDIVPLHFLDSDVQENHEMDRGLTFHLYGGDNRYRLKQEIILGIGGALMLQSLGIAVKKFHMNEGHAALLTLELLKRTKRQIEEVWEEDLVWDVEKVRDLCVFTTHTPVEAGHDRFDWDLVSDVMGDTFPLDAFKKFGDHNNGLNMTTLALNLSDFHNGVAKKHGEVSQNMFPGYEIKSITNGVHSRTWTDARWQEIYNQYIPGWSAEPELFVRVDNIPDAKIWETHQECKRELLEIVRERTKISMDENILTLGFARRATPYKRADLLFRDIAHLSEIAGGKLQIIYAGKAHPKDGAGKENIHKIIEAARALAGSHIPVVFLENYDMDLALKIIAGTDLWLNTPLRPREASGTSGMKATHNGVPNFSVLDGWWIEGHIEGVTGWSIGPNATETNLDAVDESLDVRDLYDKLEHQILPTYYANDEHKRWIGVMKGAIGKNACYFNTHRMMRQYVTEAYIR